MQRHVNQVYKQRVLGINFFRVIFAQIERSISCKEWLQFLFFETFHKKTFWVATDRTAPRCDSF